MSTISWHTYGYGICIDNLKEEVKKDRLISLIQAAPKFYQSFCKWEEEFPQEADVSDILEYFVEDYTQYPYGNLGSILQEVIKEQEEIEFTVCDNYNCENFLLYEPDYPWKLRERSEKEQNLTEEQITAILAKYLSIVTDEELPVDYYSVENAG